MYPRRKKNHTLISDTQTGFMKGRYINKIHDFFYDMSHTEVNNLPGLFVVINF